MATLSRSLSKRSEYASSVNCAGRWGLPGVTPTAIDEQRGTITKRYLTSVHKLALATAGHRKITVVYQGSTLSAITIVTGLPLLRCCGIRGQTGGL